MLAPNAPAAPDAGRAPAAAAGDAAGGAPAWPFAHLSVDVLEAALAKAMESDEMRARLTFAALDTEGSGELSHASLRLLLFHWWVRAATRGRGGGGWGQRGGRRSRPPQPRRAAACRQHAEHARASWLRGS